MKNKNIWAITDLQYGSSGKGFVTGLLSYHPDVEATIRTGAPQAGHIVYFKGKKYVGRTIPVGRINPSLKLFVGSGGVINLDVFKEELKDSPFPVEDRLFVSDRVVVVTPEDIEWEKQNLRYGSTFEGIGHARSRRVVRKAQLLKDYVKNNTKYKWMKQFMVSNEKYLDMVHKIKGKILLEGHQGYGLSNWFGDYPYVTSVDTTVAANLSEAGLPPSNVENVFGVLRTYEIRIAGNSGSLKNEIKWDDIPTKPTPEKTTVTKKIRRVGTIDWSIIKTAVKVNGVSQLCITHADYLSNKKPCSGDLASGFENQEDFEKVNNFVYKAIEKTNQTPVGLLNFSPKYNNFVSMSGIFAKAGLYIGTAELSNE